MHYPITELSYQDEQLIKQKPIIQDTVNNIAFIFHVFYSDIWEQELNFYLKKIKIPHDIYITVPHTMSETEIIKILKSAPTAHIYQTQNKGRDVLPFLQVMDIIGTDRYKYICKLHTKKSAGRTLGTVWRKLLYFDLIGSNGIVSNILDIFEENQDIGMITGKHTVLDAQKYYLNNRSKTDNLLALLHINIEEDYQFAGGTMFWVKPQIFEPLIHLYRTGQLVFEEELKQMDNTLAHAIERVLGILCHVKQQQITKSPSKYTELTEETLNSVASLVLSQTYVGQDIFLKQKEDLQYKDRVIESKTEEIIDAHKEMEKRDLEIVNAHVALAESIELLKDKDIKIKQKNYQIEQKNYQIEFLQALTLKRRIKQRIKKIIPNKILTLLGFSPYEKLTLPYT